MKYPLTSITKTIGSLLLAGFCFLSARFALAKATPLAEKAREQIGVTTAYDPAYRKIGYPGGDVPIQSGVCSDVVVRAFRGLNIDLQKEVHEDMAQAFDQYPRKWGLKHPDANIDHRRVPNLMTCFERKGWSVPSSRQAADFHAGDVVAWDLGGGVTHIGIVSDRRSAPGTPLVIHNIGRGAQEEDILFAYKIIGHYRPQIGSAKIGAATAAAPHR
jgi:uncharacterized protein YijF (DUF1287 family)